MTTSSHIGQRPRPDTEPRRRFLRRLLAPRSLGLSVPALALSLAAALPLLPSPAKAGSEMSNILAYHPETGTLRFAGSASRTPIARLAGINTRASAAQAARAFISQWGRSFGIGDQTRELRLASVRPASGGRAVVRLRQVHAGIPVLGGELVLNLDRSGNLLSAGGETSPAPDLSVVPSLARAAARRIAVGRAARAHGVSPTRLHAGEPRLWIYDPRLIGGPGDRRATLVWRVAVEGTKPEPVDELVLVDARRGVVALHFDQLETAELRRVCDAKNTAAQVPCIDPARAENDPPSSIPDVNDAFRFSGDTYTFFLHNFGRDSIDGTGMILTSTTRYCPAGEPCPYENAYWDGGQMVYGQGFASADDVVAHELTHGVVDRSSRLFYYYQSGAISESLADTFGEFVDLTNGAGTDTPRARWRLGEDLPIGAVRDMKNPPHYGQPDRMTSRYYTSDAKEEDAGGVHTNSGVGNKAAYLITDGGRFNGRTVKGLGVAKAARIYYEVATNLLTSASDYVDLSYALPQGCRNLVGTAGISEQDCLQVAVAVDAVEMRARGPASGARKARLCPGPGTPQNLFFDDLEDPGSGNWTAGAASGTNSWYYPQNPNPYLDATYATSGETNFWAVDSTSVSDSSIAMTRGVTIPEGQLTYLRFSHAYGFEDSGLHAFDGGVVEYSADRGATWIDAGPLFVDNGYSGSISAGFENPLAGRRAFVRESNGYGSSRATLAPLAGSAVRFRFRIATGDGFRMDYGWFVDDVRIYTCPSHPPTTRIDGPSKILAGRKVAWVFSAADPLPDDQVGIFRYEIDWNGDGRTDLTARRGGAIRVSHRYRRAGRHRMIARATDGHGFTGSSAAKRIKVRPSGRRRR